MVDRAKVARLVEKHDLRCEERSTGPIEKGLAQRHPDAGIAPVDPVIGVGLVQEQLEPVAAREVDVDLVYRQRQVFAGVPVLQRSVDRFAESSMREVRVDLSLIATKERKLHIGVLASADTEEAVDGPASRHAPWERAIPQALNRAPERSVIKGVNG